MFKKLIIRIIAIFIGLFATFTIENGREKNDEILLIEGIIQSLRVEIVDNIDYSKEHLRQLENMIYLSKKILDKFEDLEVKEVYQYYNEAPFLHRFNINGEIKYIVEIMTASPLKFFLVHGIHGTRRIFILNPF